MPDATPTLPSLRVDPRRLMDLYLRGQHDALTEAFLATLGEFHETTFYALDPQTQNAINRFLHEFLHLFCQQDYRVAARYVPNFLQLNATIANLAALSHF